MVSHFAFSVEDILTQYISEFRYIPLDFLGSNKNTYGSSYDRVAYYGRLTPKKYRKWLFY